MSRASTPIDNAPTENFFGIIKSECINRQKIKDFAMAKSLTDDYIHFYNHERIQLKTKLTPLERGASLRNPFPYTGGFCSVRTVWGSSALKQSPGGLFQYVCIIDGLWIQV